MKTFRVLKKKNHAQLERSLPASVELAILPKYINEIHPAAVIVAGYGKSDLKSYCLLLHYLVSFLFSGEAIWGAIASLKLDLIAD